MTNLSLKEGIVSVKGTVVERHAGGMVSIELDEMVETKMLGMTNRFNVRAQDCMPLGELKKKGPT